MEDPSGREPNRERVVDPEEEPSSRDQGWVLNSMRSRVIASCLLYTSLIIVLVAVSTPGLTDMLGNSNNSLEGRTSGTMGSVADNASLQALQLVWNKTFPEAPNSTWMGNREDCAINVLDSDDGGFVILGRTNTLGAGHCDFYLLKIDGDGSKIWERAYGGPGSDEPAIWPFGGIVKSGDGGFVLAGYTTIDQEKRTWVLRVDGQGDVVWNRTYGNGSATYLARTRDGGFLVGASKLFKINRDGKRVWESPFGGGPVVETGDGGYVVAGGQGMYKLSKQGNVIWEVICSASLGRLIGTSDGGFLGGGPTGPVSYSERSHIVKVDSHGNKIWEEVCGNGTYNSVEALFDRGGGVSLVVGRTETYVSGQVFVVEFDDMGRIRWQRFYGGDSSIWVRRVIETADGGYLVVGDLRSVGETPEGPSLGKSDAYVLKIDSQGEEVMDGAYGWNWSDVAFDAVEIRAGEFIVVGHASLTFARQDAWVFRIKMPIPESGGFPTIAYVALLGFIPLTTVGLAFVARLSRLQPG